MHIPRWPLAKVLPFLVAVPAVGIWTSHLSRMPARVEERLASNELHRLRALFLRYRDDVGHFPPRYDFANDYLIAVHDLSSLWKQPEGVSGWQGPYVRGIEEAGDELLVDSFFDPWGQAYRVAYFRRNGRAGKSGALALLSAGPDGELASKAQDVAEDLPVGDDRVCWVLRPSSEPAESRPQSAPPTSDSNAAETLSRE